MSPFSAASLALRTPPVVRAAFHPQAGVHLASPNAGRAFSSVVTTSSCSRSGAYVYGRRGSPFAPRRLLSDQPAPRASDSDPPPAGPASSNGASVDPPSSSSSPPPATAGDAPKPKPPQKTKRRPSLASKLSIGGQAEDVIAPPPLATASPGSSKLGPFSTLRRKKRWLHASRVAPQTGEPGAGAVAETSALPPVPVRSTTRSTPYQAPTGKGVPGSKEARRNLTQRKAAMMKRLAERRDVEREKKLDAPPKRYFGQPEKHSMDEGSVKRPGKLRSRSKMAAQEGDGVHHTLQAIDDGLQSMLRSAARMRNDMMKLKEERAAREANGTAPRPKSASDKPKKTKKTRLSGAGDSGTNEGRRLYEAEASQGSVSERGEQDVMKDTVGNFLPRSFVSPRMSKGKEVRVDWGPGLERDGDGALRRENWGEDRLAPPAEETPSGRPSRYQNIVPRRGSSPFLRPSDPRRHPPPHIPIFKRPSSTPSSLADEEAHAGPTEDALSPDSEESPQPGMDEFSPDSPLAYRKLLAQRFQWDTRGKLSADDVSVEKVPPLREMKVARLHHGLDRVLFNPGVHWLRDPRSQVYNFTPYLSSILDVNLFDYDALPPYITSSRDTELAELAKQHGRKFVGSTSSMTGLLSQVYFLLSGWKDTDTGVLSSVFANSSRSFSAGARLPASIKLRHHSGHYAIDADKSFDTTDDNVVLSQLGRSMEKMLTASPDDFARYHKNESWRIGEEERNQREAYHYCKTDKLLMRSQLDCYDPRLPRGTFDLKTRAAVAIRMDRANYVENSGYQIRYAHGMFESFEREYYDMIRSAFLKYNFQVRIGHMDGIFVAYHNTARIFGFQYVSQDELDSRVFGSSAMGDQAFKLSLGLLEVILDRATACFPDRHLRITFETRDIAMMSDTMQVFIEPDEEGEEHQQAHQQSPPLSAQSGSEGEAISSSSAGGASVQGSKIVQMEVAVDRYLNGMHVTGPMTFETAFGGDGGDGFGHASAGASEAKERIMGTNPAVHWEVEYGISLRPDLTEAQIRANLADLRKRQTRLSTLVVPNFDAIRERTLMIESELSNMPAPPSADAAAAAAVGGDAAKAEGAKLTLLGTDEENDDPFKYRLPTRSIMRLRELARLGAAEQKAMDERGGEPVVWKPYTPPPSEGLGMAEARGTSEGESEAQEQEQAQALEQEQEQEQAQAQAEAAFTSSSPSSSP